MPRGILKKISSFITAAVLALVVLPVQARADSADELKTLEMYFEPQDLVVTATRNPKPLSQSAENITVISSADIEMMGAHTLADVLNNVSGLQVDDRGGVGVPAGFDILGSDPRHVLVLLDGVALNDPASGDVDPASIPVQNVERVEVIKGPASSAWGSALGGVVNIVTKSPAAERRFGGTLSSSLGEKLTRDTRGEASGTVDRLGYYLFAGSLVSDGLRPHNAVDINNLYAKLTWDLPGRGSILYTLAYNRLSRGDGEAPSFDFSLGDHFRQFLSTLSLAYPLGDKVTFDLSLRTRTLNADASANSLNTGTLYQDNNFHVATSGASAKFSWREGANSLVLGGDFDHDSIEDDSNYAARNIFSHLALRSDKWGVFLNDTLTAGNVAITPGVRYDRMNPTGDFFSPSLGVAWSVTDHLVLRAYAARGYSLPLLLPGQPQQKVVTLQGGAETTRIPGIWLKATLFSNYLSDVQVINSAQGTIDLARQRKQGVEVEAKTIPLFNTSLSAGYAFVDAKNRDTGEVLQNLPRQIGKFGLHYDDGHSLRGALIGRYVWWNASAQYNARYNAVICDLVLAKKVYERRGSAVELFFNAHNLFNGAQYSFDAFKNARRWVEGGIRIDF